MIPILGWLILIIGAIVMPILWIWGMVAALRGKVSRVPLLGRISDGFSF